MMTQVLTFPVQSWMRKQGLRKVFKALDSGKKGDIAALLVGGCVRDALLGQDVSDIDIATVHCPGEVTRRLEKAGIKAIPTGIKHGTVTAVAGSQSFEITTLRHDVKTDGRRADVAFTDDWTADATRRDFTMNALYMGLDGTVYDPTGQGVADLKARRVRFVGDPARRIAEDYLRILRFFRFYARFGKGAPDEHALVACDAAKDKITTLSRERITQEFEKLLRAKNAGEAIEVMLGIGLMADVVQKRFNKKLYTLLRCFVAQNEAKVKNELLFAYTVYENKPDKLNTKTAKYFVLSNAQKLYLKKILEFMSDHSDNIEKNIYHFGKDVTLSGMVLSSLFNDKRPTVKSFEAMLEAVEQCVPRRLPVTGRDVAKATGLSEGKALGDILQKVERWWLKNDMVPDRDACLAQAKRYGK